jgi:hypothetical protein
MLLMHSQAHPAPAQSKQNKEPEEFKEAIKSEDSELQDFLEVEALCAVDDVLLVGPRSISAPILIEGVYHKVDKGKVIGKICRQVLLLFAELSVSKLLQQQFYCR